MSALENVRRIADVPSEAALAALVDEYLGSLKRSSKLSEVDNMHRALILTQPIVRNPLYQRMCGRQLTSEDYQWFFPDYLHGSTKFFYETILNAARMAHPHAAWQRYLDHIYDEETHPQPHWELFRELASACGYNVRQGPGHFARRYAREQLAGYIADLPFAAGYALAVEVQAGFEIAVQFVGMSTVFPGPVNETLWFAVHLGGDQEEEHSRASVELIESVAGTKREVDRARDGFLKYCADVDRFMTALNTLMLA